MIAIFKFERVPDYLMICVKGSSGMANSINNDQTAASGTGCFGFILFDLAYVSD